MGFDSRTFGIRVAILRGSHAAAFVPLLLPVGNGLWAGRPRCGLSGSPANLAGFHRLTHLRGLRHLPHIRTAFFVGPHTWHVYVPALGSPTIYLLARYRPPHPFTRCSFSHLQPFAPAAGACFTDGAFGLFPFRRYLPVDTHGAQTTAEQFSWFARYHYISLHTALTGLLPSYTRFSSIAFLPTVRQTFPPLPATACPAHYYLWTLHTYV